VKFFETIRVEEGRALHLHYHNARLNRTIADHFGRGGEIDLAHYLSPPKRGIFRCRVVYSQEIEEIGYSPYTPRTINSLTLVESTVQYRYKYLDRRELERVAEEGRKRGADGVIIVQNGLLTDCSIANIALFDGTEWRTPATPLLPGTTRARLLDEGVLRPAPLTPHDLLKAEKIALLNAMVGFYQLDNPIIL